jgi:hypothetical protein
MQGLFPKKYVFTTIDKSINITIYYFLDKHQWQFTLLCLDMYRRMIGFLEEKLHVAYNLRFLVVINLTGKGAHKMRREKYTLFERIER